jgi:nitroreductase
MIEGIKRRLSVRKYTDRPVDEQTIMSLIESARLAPSGHNTQPWHFIIVRDSKMRKTLAKVSHNQPWMMKAPVFIACVADIRSRPEMDNVVEVDEESPQFELKQVIRDTAIAAEHLVLEATSQGLGTCWVAWFVQEEIRPLLGLAKDKYLVCIITVGYTDGKPRQVGRKAIEEMVHYERW